MISHFPDESLEVHLHLAVNPLKFLCVSKRRAAVRSADFPRALLFSVDLTGPKLLNSLLSMLCLSLAY